MKNIPEFISAAVKNEPDYSKSFSKKIAALAQSIKKLINLEVSHGESMDYCPAQYIEINLKDQINHSPKTNFEIRFYISSKAELFFIYINDKTGKIKNHHEISHPLSPEILPETAKNIILKIKKFLIENSYQEVLYEYYDQEAAGYLTQMDGLRANIFEALFAEIV
ncbi:hypothetical protein M4R22_11670 [Acidovorax sp. GBBC 3334]|uniref:hypothetical protein n=1 Tax=Acidovorax sp. GBBC 3334 TaxID=2940496 RepID=UPI00230452A7|nr:hypothetical protein [Acidovorax sp. GBBC 3334]MDA8455420.1 hypothetical protein [Acidovorax sp. GBBC 3334]